MDTPEKRLRWALEESGRSKRWLSEQLAARGVYGASYPTVIRYFKGERDPRRDFWDNTAELLGVRLPWLLSGEGLPGTPPIPYWLIAEEDLPDWVPDSARVLYLQTAIRFSDSRVEREDPGFVDTREEMESRILGAIDNLEQLLGHLSGHKRERMIIDLIQTLDRAIPTTAADRAQEES